VPFRAAPSLAWQLVDGESVIIDLANGRTLGLNPTGSLIWSLLADHDEAAIARELARRFDVPLAAARRDVGEFLRSLVERRLVAEA
jgi:hypothetical protein